jgi:ParB/RepB/Spo0J family partition protein
MQINLLQIALPEIDLRADVDEETLDELADSLRDIGQLQAIGIKPIWKFGSGRDCDPEEWGSLDEYHQAGGLFEVVFGARRTRAAKMLKWSTIRAEYVTDRDETQTAAVKLIENVQRQDLTPIEEAYGLFALIGEGETNVRTLQKQTGKSRDWIHSRLALLDLPEDIQGAVQTGLLGIAVAQHLGRIQNPDVRDMYVRHAIENGCTAETAKVWASQAQFAEQGIIGAAPTPEEMERMNQPNEFVPQMWTCFSCHEAKDFRQINMLVVCGNCQNDITDARHGKTPEHNPMDRSQLTNPNI